MRESEGKRDLSPFLLARCTGTVPGEFPAPQSKTAFQPGKPHHCWCGRGTRIDRYKPLHKGNSAKSANQVTAKVTVTLSLLALC